MTKQTVLEEVNERMKQIKETKSADIDRIGTLQQEAHAKLEAAELAMKQAMEVMDVDAYEEGKHAKHKAQTALDMYNGRFNQIKTQEYISEEESDKIISSLLDYEQTLGENFKFSAAEPLKKLADLLNAYNNEIAETERVLSDWQHDIHANYQSPITLYTDPATGKKSHRSPRPIPVHSIPYLGCNEAMQLSEYLQKAEPLFNDDQNEMV